MSPPLLPSSTYKVSASGCFHALRILPILKSRRETSTAFSPPPPPPPPGEPLPWQHHHGNITSTILTEPRLAVFSFFSRPFFPFSDSLPLSSSTLFPLGGGCSAGLLSGSLGMAGGTASEEGTVTCATEKSPQLFKGQLPIYTSYNQFHRILCTQYMFSMHSSAHTMIQIPQCTSVC